MEGRGSRGWWNLKTAKRVSTTFEMQLAAYNHAEFIVVDGVEREWEPTEGGIVLRVTATGNYMVDEVDVSAPTYRAFAAAAYLDQYLGESKWL